MSKTRRIASACAAAVIWIYAAACRPGDTAFQQASAVDTPAAWQSFINEHPGHPKKASAESALERLCFEEARWVDTLAAYRSFLQTHPAGPHAGEARARAEEVRYILAQERRKAFLGVDTVKIVLKQETSAREPVMSESDLAKWFETAGVEVLPGGSSFAGGVVTVTLAGEAVDAGYTYSDRVGGKTLFTGAQVRASVTFRGAAGREFTDTVNYDLPPARFVTLGEYEAGPVEPRDAPIRAAALTGIIGKMIEMIGTYCGRRAEVDCWITVLQDHFPFMLESRAEEFLSAAREMRAAPALIRTLPATSETVTPAAKFLESIPEVITDRRLACVLIDRVQESRNVECMRLLGKAKERRVVEPLIEILYRPELDTDERLNAAWALGAIGDSRAIGPLEGIAKDPDWQVARAALWALGGIQDEGALRALLAALCSDDKWRRYSAAAALGRLRDRRATDTLVNALKDRDPDMRRAALQALGEMGDPKALGAVQAQLHDAEWTTRTLAWDAILKIDPAWIESDAADRTLAEFANALSGGVLSQSPFERRRVEDALVQGREARSKRERLKAR
jgi:HEAT repeat protein